MNVLRNLHPLEPQAIRANVPAPDGAMQSGNAVDVLSTTSDMHKAQAGTRGSGAGEGGLAQEGIVMNQDEIIAMAKEAGLGNALGGVDGLDEVTRFAALVAAKEREACAQVCDELAALNRVGAPGSATWEQEECAAAIRARGVA